MTLSPGDQSLPQPSPMSDAENTLTSDLNTDGDDTLSSLETGPGPDDAGSEDPRCDTEDGPTTEAGEHAPTSGSDGRPEDPPTLAAQKSPTERRKEKRSGKNGLHGHLQSSPVKPTGAAAISAAASVPKTSVYGYLPETLWLRIMEMLDLYDRFQMTQTCMLFRRLFFHPQLWRRVDLVCSVGALPPTTAASGGEREEAPVCMRPSHKRIAAEFGHLFQHVNLHFADSRRHLEPETQQVLTRLADTWTLRGLQLSTSFEELAVIGGPLGANRYARSGRKVAVEIVRKAKALRHLDLSEWPILLTKEALHFQFPPNPDLLLWDAIGAEREAREEAGEESLLDVLMEEDTCPQLCSLNVARRTFPYHELGSDPQTLKAELRCSEHAVRLATKLRRVPSLSFTLRQAMLSDQLLRELAYVVRRGEARPRKGAVSRRLTVVNCDPVSAEPAGQTHSKNWWEESTSGACPDLTENAWRALRDACCSGDAEGRDGLEVEAVARVFHVPALRWLLQPCVPLVSLSLYSCSVPPSLLRCALQCRATLRFLCCHILPSPGLDAALLELSEGCSRLRQLVYFGTVASSSVLALAALDRQWITFSFRQKRIVFPPDPSEGGGRPADAVPPSTFLPSKKCPGSENVARHNGDLPLGGDGDPNRDVLDENGAVTLPPPAPGESGVGKSGRAFFPSPRLNSSCFTDVSVRVSVADAALAAKVSAGKKEPGGPVTSSTVSSAADLADGRPDPFWATRPVAATSSPTRNPSNEGEVTAPLGKLPDCESGRQTADSREKRARPNGSCSFAKTTDAEKGRQDRRRLRLERERRRKAQIDRLSVQVSKLLGYPWQPADV